MVSFFSFLIIILYLVSSLDSIVTPPRDSTTIGDTFMACTDVAAIHPRPFSLLNREDNQSMVFNVTYSRPVFLAKPQNVAFMAGDSGLFTRIKNYHWGSATFLTSSHTELILTFNITMETLRMYREIYLVLDGGCAYSVTYAMGGYWYPFVPTRTYKYYLDPNVPRPQQPRQIDPSVYVHCSIRRKRPLPDPFYETPLTDNLLATLIADDSKIVQALNGSYRLELTVKLSGSGTTMMRLPSKINARLYGYNLTVSLPPGSELSFVKSDSWYRIPVESKITHEVIEKLYNTWNILPTIRPHTRSHIPKPDRVRDLIKVVQMGGNYAVRTLETNSAMLKFFHVFTNNIGSFSRDGGTASIGDYKHIYGNQNFQYYDDRHKADKLYSTTCWADSVRSSPFGQGSLIVDHVFEIGPYYRLVMADFDAIQDWFVISQTKIISNNIDVTSSVSFGGPNLPKTRVPLFLYEALHKYAVLLRPLSEDLDEDVLLPLDEGIYVPRSEVHSGCNGLMFYEANYQGQTFSNFCEMKHGTCIGLPFTSTSRFPVIPPFGVPDWAGWTSNRSNMDSKLFGSALHPIGQHSMDETMVPRALYMYDNNARKRFFYLSAPETYEDYISKIPITGIKPLLPNIDTTCSEDKMKVEKVIKRETLIAVYVVNNGEGGTDVTLRMQCTDRLSLIPSSAEKTIWAESGTNTKATFTLDATKSVIDREETHTCEVTVTVQYLPEANINRGYTCSIDIVTHYGLFSNPCHAKEVPLPQIDIIYFVLPPSQYHSSFRATIETILSSSSSRRMLFMRNIAMTLEAAQLENYVSDLLKITVECGSEYVYVFEEKDAIHQATLLVLGRVESSSIWNKRILSFHSSLLNHRRFYFIANRVWALDKTKNSLTNSSDCSITLWANRPHKYCDNPTIVSVVGVPLVETDTETVKKKREFWYVEPIYGTQPPKIMLTLLVCVGVTGFCSLCTVAGHSLMMFFEKQLPNLKKKRKLRKQLEFVQNQDKKSWETPQMFLQKGRYGPYYTLFNFKGTEPLSVPDLKTLKMAGLLKYQDKELQVMFGHIKNIYSVKNSKSGDLWLQASSGWYLLKLENVHEEYREELMNFYEQTKTKFKEP